MPLEQPRPGEALSAILTFATLIVSPHVHGEGWHADVHLVAMRTPPGFLIGRASMGLAMSGEVAGGAVSLAALGAFVLVTLGG